MNQTLSTAIVLLLAVLAANLPFVNQRWLAIGPRADKSLFHRLLEWLLAYFVVGGVALLLEKNAGQIAPQGWEFYAITVCLFATLAFPGFVYRYLLKHR